MSVAELARKADLHRNTLRSYETGQRAIDKETFVNLCVVLDVDAAEVFAAACLAKIRFELQPMEEQKREARGMPLRRRSGDPLPGERFKELLSSSLNVMGGLIQFTFEHLSGTMNQEALLRLNPESLRDLEPGKPVKKKVKRRKAKKPERAKEEQGL